MAVRIKDFRLHMLNMLRYKKFVAIRMFDLSRHPVIKSRKLKDRQHNGQKKKDKRTNNYLQNIHIKLKIEQHELMAKKKRKNNSLQNITQKTKVRKTRTSLKLRVNLCRLFIPIETNIILPFNSSHIRFVSFHTMDIVRYHFICLRTQTPNNCRSV